MPIYGDEKRREIARNSLASSKRRRARNDLATVKRHNRRTIRHALNNLGFVASEVVDNYDGDPVDFNFYPNGEINYIARDRRDYENLGAALRWAPHQVKNVRLMDRSSKIRTMLPDTLQGRHVASHIDDLDEFSVAYPHDWWRYYWRRSNALERHRAYLAEKELLEAAVAATIYDILAVGLHQRLNDLLSPRQGFWPDWKYDPDWPAWRIQGFHDIDRFVAGGKVSEWVKRFETLGVVGLYYANLQRIRDVNATT